MDALRKRMHSGLVLMEIATGNLVGISVGADPETMTSIQLHVQV